MIIHSRLKLRGLSPSVRKVGTDPPVTVAVTFMWARNIHIYRHH